nr:DUF4126 domain-containing protein [Chloroflexota bacterium]
AGLNAYLPLLLLALADRITDRITLDQPYDFLSSGWGIAVITFLLTVEVIADKIPGIDHANDLIQSAIRPAAGATLMMASTSDGSSLNPVVAMLVGLVTAGSVHAAKATSRPAITLSTGGLGNPLVSLVEDGVALVTGLVAIISPVLVLVPLVAFFALPLYAYRRLRRRAPRSSQVVVPNLRQ